MPTSDPQTSSSANSSSTTDRDKKNMPEAKPKRSYIRAASRCKITMRVRTGVPMENDQDERRQSQRVAVAANVTIQYRNADQFFTDYIRNISQGGIFVPTPQPLPKDTHLHITFALPGYDQPISTEGVVVRSIQAGPETPVGPSGMGIQFQALSQTDLECIDAYIALYPS